MPPALFLITPVVALLASSLVIAVIRYLDVLEREPWWTIGLSFLVGLVTVPVSIVLFGFTADMWIALLGDEAPLKAIQMVIDAPLVEEFVKGAAVFAVLLLIRHEIDSLTDFIVYACVVAVAFEFCENTLYLWTRLSQNEGSALAWMTEFNARTIASAGMHAMFTSWVGFALWCAMKLGSGSRRWLGALIGVSVAMLLHCMNNLGAYLSSVGDPYAITMLNQFGLSIGVLSKLLQMALFLALMGSAILLDLHLIGDYGLALQQRLKDYSPEQQLLGMSRLQALLNPFHHMLSHANFTWRLTSLPDQSPVARPEYSRFAKMALHYGESSGDERQRDLENGLSLLIPAGSNIN